MALRVRSHGSGKPEIHGLKQTTVGLPWYVHCILSTRFVLTFEIHMVCDGCTFTKSTCIMEIRGGCRLFVKHIWPLNSQGQFWSQRTFLKSFSSWGALDCWNGWKLGSLKGGWGEYCVPGPFYFLAFKINFRSYNIATLPCQSELKGLSILVSLSFGRNWRLARAQIRNPQLHAKQTEICMINAVYYMYAPFPDWNGIYM